MTVPKQDQNMGEMRRSIGRNLGIVTIGAATADGGDTSSLIDTTNLIGGDDEHNGKQVEIYDAAGTGTIVSGEIRRVTDYAGSTSDATCSAFTANITTGDKFEMWATPWLIADINDSINQAIMAVSAECLKEKKLEETWTVANTYEYDCLSDFVGLHKVEYVVDVGTEDEIDNCDTAWTAGTNVTATADTSFKKEGTASAKLVVASGAAAGGILGYGTISSLDLSDCDYVEFWLYSSIALAAGELDLVLSASAAIAATTESIDVPATTAARWTRHVVALANPHSDTAIISVGLVNTTDVGACTLYIDDIEGISKGTRKYRDLNPQYWTVVRNSTNYLKLTPSGLSVIGSNTLLRLSGYQLPDLLSDDTTDCDIDPYYVVAAVCGQLAINHAKSSRLELDNREDKGKVWLSIAESRKSQMRTTIRPDSRFF